MSKPASIQKIIKIEKHPNADKLEIATVLGWRTIVKKDEFKENDLIIYIEVDSVLPKLPQYEFIKNIKKSEDGKEMYYIRNIKLRGELSQGLILPLSSLDLKTYQEDGRIYYGAKTGELSSEGIPLYLDLDEGIEVSSLLGIEHYEKKIHGSLSGVAKGGFPAFLIKTDEERIQNIPYKLKELKDTPYYISVKCDGTSGTFFYNDGQFGVCSRNLELKEDENSIYWKIAKKYKIEQILSSIGKDLCIQGEICGPSIQSNPIGLNEIDLFVFNIFDIKAGRYFSFNELYDFCIKNNLKTVPIIEKSEAPFKLFNYTLEELIEKAKGFYDNTENNREGIVVRSLDSRISFKVINNDYIDE
jgi:RNA ligase (TIGR02306 family)